MNISLKATWVTYDHTFFLLSLYLCEGILIYCLRIPEIFNLKISVIK